MVSPTGNTKPPMILSRPGFEAFSPGEPPWMISESSPPNDSRIPAENCAHILVSDMQAERGREGNVRPS